MLWRGEVVRPSTDEETTALRTLNDVVHADPRVDASLVTIGDGLLLARKR
jgi:predicted O-methyltransferase YrrM